MQNYTVIAFTKNKPGILYRVSDLFLRRKINIESLTVSETEIKGVSRFTIVVHTDKSTIEKIVKQLYRIIEMIKVFESEDHDLIYKELAFIKVSTKNPIERKEVEDLALLFQAKINYVGPEYMVIEKTGTEDAISSLFNLLKPLGIKEFIRSGRIAISKDQKRSKHVLAKVKESSHLTASIEVSAIKRVQIMAAETPGVISLAQGKPADPTPLHVKEAAKDAIDRGYCDAYTVGYGIQPLREAIAKKLASDNQIIADPSQIIVTHGAIEGLMATFMAIFNPEDEIIILTPDYASHVTQVQIARHGGRPIFVPLQFDTAQKEWILDPDRIESGINQKTKGILICNPCNPTGKVYTREELKQIADIALRHNLYIITDEIYEYFTHDNRPHVSIGSFPEVADRVISIMGVSKSYCMTGWRIGYIAAHKKIIQDIFKVHDSLVTCPTAVSQYAALAAIGGPKDPVLTFQKEYSRKRDIVVSELNTCSKLSFAIPQGAYYAFVKVEGIDDDYQLAFDLIHKAKVALVPGSAFGLGGEGYLRISFCYSEDDIREGLKRFIDYIK